MSPLTLHDLALHSIYSDSVELCETEVCFLHIQLIGPNVRLQKMYKTPPEVDFESYGSPAKSEPWNKPIDNAVPCFSHDNISLGQYFCELVFGVNVFDLDFGVQIDSIEQPIKNNSVGSGNMSHCGTPS